MIFDEVCEFELCERPATHVARDYVRIKKENGRPDFVSSEKPESTHYYCNFHKLPPSEVEK